MSAKKRRARTSTVSERWLRLNAGKVKTHSPSQCKGQSCTLHNPSKHHMATWPLVLRASGLMERLRTHGVGHPDPDSLRYMISQNGHGSSWVMHGCDGCCTLSKGEKSLPLPRHANEGHSKVWRTFLRITPDATRSEVPAADPAWLMSKGIEMGAPAVLELVRKHLFPWLRANASHLRAYWFLVHDRDSGVPTTADDKNAYLDITLVFYDMAARPELPPAFVLTQADALSGAAGWDTNVLVAGIDSVHRLLFQQTQLLEAFVMSFKEGTDTFAMLKHLRQFYHYFANHSQMRIA